MDTHASFLGLPSAIRLRIYLMVIPQSGYPNNLNPERSYSEIRPYKDAFNLMLTCQMTYTEASPMLYSGNHFFIRYQDHGNLTALRYLLPSSVASICHLTIHLNVSSCEQGSLCCKGHSMSIMHDCTRKHGQPLRSSSSGYQALLSEWRCVVSYLNMHIQPSKLNLYFICDVEDVETAKAIMEPLLDQRLPTLASCNIRLGEDCDNFLYDLAWKAAAQAMRQQHVEKKSSQKPFQFLDLPLELQYKILEYTDLVAPHCEVTWNPNDGLYLHYFQIFRDDYYCPPEIHSSICQIRNCARFLNNGCFCQRYHAAFSPICNCWCPPIPLFLVSRSFHALAQHVFFSKNHFVIMPFGGVYYEAPKSTPLQFEASVFLRDVVPSRLLHLLKFLEVVIPPADPDYMSSESSAYKDWDKTISYLQRTLYPGQLTLRIYFHDFRCLIEASPYRKSFISREQGFQTIIATYDRILLPLSRLQGLLNWCFIHAAWPWAWTPDGIQMMLHHSKTIRRDQLQIEDRLEKQVMGDKSEFARNNEPEESQWLQFFNGYADQIRCQGIF